jgi:hypothetical protein
MVLARNTISGNIADVSPKMLEHPQFKDILEVVAADAKPYIPEMYAPGTKAEKKSKRISASAKEVVAVEEPDVFEDTEKITDIEEKN